MTTSQLLVLEKDTGVQTLLHTCVTISLVLPLVLLLLVYTNSKSTATSTTNAISNSPANITTGAVVSYCVQSISIQIMANSHIILYKSCTKYFIEGLLLEF